MSAATDAATHRIVSSSPMLVSLEKTPLAYVALQPGHDGVTIGPEDACPWPDLAEEASHHGLVARLTPLICCDSPVWASASLDTPTSGLRRDAFRVAWCEPGSQEPEHVWCIRTSTRMLRVLLREVLRPDAPHQAAEASFASLRSRAVAAGVLPAETPPWPERAELLDRVARHGVPTPTLLHTELPLDQRVALLADLAPLAEGVQRLIYGVLNRALGTHPTHTHRKVAGRSVLASAWNEATPAWVQVSQRDGIAQVTDLRLPLVASKIENRGQVFVAEQERWLRRYYGSAVGPTHTPPNASSPPEGRPTS